MRFFSATLFAFSFNWMLANSAHAEIEIEQLDDDLSGLSAEERAFFEDDSFFQSLAVSTGNLKWVEPELTQDSYSLTNTITIDQQSLQNGEVKFSQCHINLDAFSKIEVVYNKTTTRDLKVIRHQGIANYVTKPFSVDLTGVEKGAEICIEGTSQTLTKVDTQENTWQLKRGPYMRKFFDGYYPMHVQESIHWQNVALELSGLATEPTPLKIPDSFMLKPNANSIEMNYYFEGRLQTNYQFTQQN